MVLSKGTGWWHVHRKRKTRGGVGSAEGPSAAGRGLKTLGRRAGRMSKVWLNARAASGAVDEGGGGGGGSSNKRRERGSAFWGSLATAGGLGNSGVTPAMLNAPDEFQRNPRLRFQLLLREQGVIVTLFDAMETVGPWDRCRGRWTSGFPSGCLMRPSWNLVKCKLASIYCYSLVNLLTSIC